MTSAGAGATAPLPTGGAENTGASCEIPGIPSFADMPSIEKLPDPFKLIDGTRIARKDQWPCLRAQLSALAQASIRTTRGIKLDEARWIDWPIPTLTA